jgi:hypothetical protein
MRMLTTSAQPRVTRDIESENPWRNCVGMPRYAAAALGALHLSDPDLDACAALSAGEWKSAIDYADRERFTLPFAAAARARMPAALRDRVDRDAAKNLVRLRGIERTYREIAEWLRSAGLEFVLLKGITHAGLFGSGAVSRVQYDLDLWLPPVHAVSAQSLLMARGYESLAGAKDLPTDHLPALVRKTGWQWRGDFFDPEIPLPVELHFQLWNPRMERVEAPGLEQFWERRASRPLAGVMLPALHPADTVAFAALHVLKHVLQGSVRVFHVYEIAAMLNARAGDDLFWAEWRELHPPGLRRLEAIVFQLARSWFGGEVSAVVSEEVESLPPKVRVWFEEFALSPARQGFHANKDQLWLHLCLLQSRRDAFAIFVLRLFPRSLPAAAGDSFVAKEDLSWRDWVRWRVGWITHTLRRAWHHAAALPATLRSGFRWWRRTR